MDQAGRWAASISLATGASAAAICAGWLWVSWDGGIGGPPPLPEDLMEFDTLQATVTLGALFMLATPR